MRLFLILLFLSGCYTEVCEYNCHKELRECKNFCERAYQENAPECIMECYDLNILCDFGCR